MLSATTRISEIMKMHAAGDGKELTQYCTFNALDKENLMNIPLQIKRAVIEIIESDPSSYFYYVQSKTECQFNFYLLEQNLTEQYVICHLFSTELTSKEQEYSYTSIDLYHVQFFSEMACALKVGLGDISI